MNTKHALIAALATALVAPAAAASGQLPDSREISRSVAREVQAATREASRQVAREVDTATREAARLARQATRVVRKESSQGPQQTEKITKSFKVGKTGSLDLNNFSGDVTVTGGAGEEIIIEATKRVRAKTAEEAKAGLDAIQVNIAERAGRVEVRTDYARRDIRGAVDYTITVPSGAAVLVRTMSGDVNVTGVKGELRADSISGDVTVTGAGQSVRAKTMSGDVAVNDVTSDGDVAFSSMSGNVTARNIKAKLIEVNSTSGDLNLLDVTCGRATGSTMSGDVEFKGPLAKGGRYELRSHSGNVRLMPTSTTGFEVDASTFSGTFRSDFPVTLRSVGPSTMTPPTPPAPPPPPPSPTPPRTTGEQTPPPPPPPPAPPDRPGRTTGERTGRQPRPGMPSRSVQGTFGDGSAVLNLISFSGDITIVKK